jgi:hypothetical protein
MGSPRDSTAAMLAALGFYPSPPLPISLGCFRALLAHGQGTRRSCVRGPPAEIRPTNRTSPRLRAAVTTDIPANMATAPTVRPWAPSSVQPLGGCRRFYVMQPK